MSAPRPGAPARAGLALYSLLTWLAQPLLRRKLRRRGREEPGYLQAVDERFGRYGVPAQSGLLWLHAVSLGETRAAAILLAQLRQQWPGLRLLLTHGTATGRAEGARLLRDGDVQVWQPWDTPGAVRRFLDHFQPCAGVLLETEVWPNLVAECRRRGVALWLANARLSEQSLHKSLRLGWLARPAYAGLYGVLAQSADDARRLRQLGARVQAVVGNLKFDARPDPGLLFQGRQWRQSLQMPVVMLASSREGEEAQFFEQIMARVRMQRSSDAIDFDANKALWLVVPRHPQRFDAVAAQARSAGFAVQRRSQGPFRAPAGATPTMLVGDTLGEMSLYYGLSDLALMGGSFAPLGGQNLIEAAACACPVVLGPSTFNFAQAAELALQAGAALRAPDMAQALRAALQWLGQDDALQQARQKAHEFVAQHQGAAPKTAQAIIQALRATPAAVEGCPANSEGF